MRQTRSDGSVEDPGDAIGLLPASHRYRGGPVRSPDADRDSRVCRNHPTTRHSRPIPAASRHGWTATIRRRFDIWSGRRRWIPPMSGPQSWLYRHYVNLGQLAVAESLAVEIRKSSEGLSAYDRLRLDFILAGLRGDRVAAYRAVRTAAEMVPGGTTHWAAIGNAVEVNRPREALEIQVALQPHLPNAVAGALVLLERLHLGPSPSGGPRIGTRRGQERAGGLAEPSSRRSRTKCVPSPGWVTSTHLSERIEECPHPAARTRMDASRCDPNGLPGIGGPRSPRRGQGGSSPGF